MVTVNYSNMEDSKEIVYEDNFNFDDPKPDLERERLADELWSMIARLSVIKSPLAHALYYVLTSDIELQSVRAGEAGVSRVRFHQLVNKVRDDLEKIKDLPDPDEGELIIFKQPIITGRKDAETYTPKKYLPSNDLNN